MLFTFGYSGVGKSFTIFGGEDKSGNKIPGVLFSIFSSIQNVNDVTVKIYEMYGMGLNQKNNFNNNVYHKYVNYTIDTNNSITESDVVDKDKINDIKGKTIKIENLSAFLEKLNSINNEIEDKRGKITEGKSISYQKGELNDGDTNIKTIKKTKNNPDSSRSILCYELIINKDGEEIPFIIVDLPGKEIIKDSFGQEGEALLEINSKNKINDEFLNNNFREIDKKIDEIDNLDYIKDLFKPLEFSKNIEDINIIRDVTYYTSNKEYNKIGIKDLKPNKIEIKFAIKFKEDISKDKKEKIETILKYYPLELYQKRTTMGTFDTLRPQDKLIINSDNNLTSYYLGSKNNLISNNGNENTHMFSVEMKEISEIEFYTSEFQKNK